MQIVGLKEDGTFRFIVASDAQLQAQTPMEGETFHYVPDGVMAWPEPNLAPLKERMWNDIKLYRESLYMAGHDIEGHLFHSDRNGVLDLMMLSNISSTIVTLRDNSQVALTGGQIGTIVTQLSAWRDAVHQHAQVLREQLNEFTDLPSLLQFNWKTDSWPQ